MCKTKIKSRRDLLISQTTGYLMRQPDYSGQFKRDVKLAQNRGKNIEKFKEMMNLLVENQPLPISYCDHHLKGVWNGFRNAHIETD